MRYTLRHIFIIAMLGLAISAMLVQTSMAQEPDQRNFIFGTRLVLTSPTQITSPNYGWWGDRLPMPYTHAIGWIVQVVNEARADSGNDLLVDYKSYPVVIGSEFQTDNGWEYSIDFLQMLPEDLDVILGSFPLEGAFSDLPMEIRPVSTGYYYGSAQDGQPVSLQIPGGPLSIAADAGYDATWARINDLLSTFIGAEVKFDLGMNQYRSASGYNNFDVNLTVYVDDSWQNQSYPLYSEYD